MKTSLLALGLFSPVLIVSAPAASLLTGGHVDAPAFGYISVAEVTLDPSLTQGFEPHIHNEGGADGAVIDGVVQTADSEYEPDVLIIVVPTLSVTTMDSTTYYWLPETELDASANGAPFLGIGLEELDPGDWVGGTVTLTLMSITGPGDFLLWQDDGFGGANVLFDSVGDNFMLAAGSHTHYNWGFTEKGIYELEFGISGTHLDDGFQSASGIYTFQIPEPSSALLAAFGAIGLLRRSRI